MSATAEFDATLALTGRNTGIVVPDEVLDALGSGRRPSVVVELAGHRYQTTIGAMKGRAMISVSAAVRQATGLQGGEDVHVRLTLAEGPRKVVVPEDLAAALRADPVAGDFFDHVSNSLQRYHVEQVTGAKSAETRQRRIDRALALFRDGRAR